MNQPWDGKGINPNLESIVATALKSLLRGVPVGSPFVVDSSDPLYFSLELYLPMNLARHHPEWTRESIDGFFTAFARKTGAFSAHFAGACILISDQTLTPFSLHLAASEEDESVAAFRLHLGEPGGGALGISGAGCSPRNVNKFLANFTDRIGDIAWSYVALS